MKIFPNFLIIGFPKAGTTSVYQHLRSHPEIYMPNNTELRYFNNVQVLKHLGGPGDTIIPNKICKDQAEYEAYFTDYSGEKAIGECTTGYIFYKEALVNIKSQFDSKVKLIVMLREPVSRAFSHYQYLVRRDKETLSFEEAIKEEDFRKENAWNDGWLYLENSLYSSRIKNLIDMQLNFKLFLFEDFKENPQDFMRQIYSYLNVDEDHEAVNLALSYNKGGVFKNRKLMKWLQSPSTIRSSVKKILPDNLIENLRNRRDEFIVSSTTPLVLKEATRAKLRSYFKGDVNELSKMTDTDLTKWGYDL